MILILKTGMNDKEKGCGGLFAAPWASSSSSFCTIFQVFFGIKGPFFPPKKYHKFSWIFQQTLLQDVQAPGKF